MLFFLLINFKMPTIDFNIYEQEKNMLNRVELSIKKFYILGARYLFFHPCDTFIKTRNKGFSFFLFLMVYMYYSRLLLRSMTGYIKINCCLTWDLKKFYWALFAN